MSAKHTLGPWEQSTFNAANGDVCHGVKSAAASIAVAWTHGITEGEAIENARLIAAAPDLLAACRALLRDMQAVDAAGQYGLELQVSMDQAHKAIAKAVQP